MVSKKRSLQEGEGSGAIVGKKPKVNDNTISSATCKAYKIIVGNKSSATTWEETGPYDQAMDIKIFFKKSLMAWEIMEKDDPDRVKKKMETPFVDIAALEFDFDGDEGSFLITLKKTPNFFKDKNKDPKKHPVWEKCPDFTNYHATYTREFRFMIYHKKLETFSAKIVAAKSVLSSLIKERSSPMGLVTEDESDKQMMLYGGSTSLAIEQDELQPIEQYLPVEEPIQNMEFEYVDPDQYIGQSLYQLLNSQTTNMEAAPTGLPVEQVSIDIPPSHPTGHVGDDNVDPRQLASVEDQSHQMQLNGSTSAACSDHLPRLPQQQEKKKIVSDYTSMEPYSEETEFEIAVYNQNFKFPRAVLPPLEGNPKQTDDIIRGVCFKNLREEQLARSILNSWC